jgi:hypothetical protein
MPPLRMRNWVETALMWKLNRDEINEAMKDLKAGDLAYAKRMMELYDAPSLSAYWKAPPYSVSIQYVNRAIKSAEIIRPLASFDWFLPETPWLAFHWSNLQPMFGIDNLMKGSVWHGQRHTYNKGNGNGKH